MHDAEAIAIARDFLETIACLAPAEDVCFRTFTLERDGLPELQALASRVATGGDDAVSSLTVRPGSAPGFDLRGAHATVTLAEAPGAGATRMGVILCLVLLVLFVVMSCARR